MEYIKCINHLFCFCSIIIMKPIENNKERVRIFGKKFVKNNQDKCKIEYKDKIYELKEYFEDIDNNYNHKDEILFKYKRK